MQVRYSVIDPQKIIRPDSWVLSILNMTDGTSMPYLPSGHSALVVEGMESQYQAGFFSESSYFIGCYEIAGLIPRDKHSRLWLLPEGGNCEKIPQDVIVLTKKGLQVRAQWRQEGKIQPAEASAAAASRNEESLQEHLQEKTLELPLDDSLHAYFPPPEKLLFEINRRPLAPWRLVLIRGYVSEMPENTLIIKMTDEGLLDAAWLQKPDNMIKQPMILEDSILQLLLPLFPGDENGYKELSWKEHKNLMNAIFSICIGIITEAPTVDRVSDLFGCQMQKADIQNHAIINHKRLISEIRVTEGPSTKKEFGAYHSRSFAVDPALAKKMIAAIKEDAEYCKQAQLGAVDYLPYQFVGTQHFLSKADEGNNCSSWCIEKMKMANIHMRHAASKPKKVVMSDVNPFAGCVML